MNFEDSDEDDIGISEEIVVDNEDGKGNENDKGNGKGKEKGKGKGKGKCKRKEKSKGKGNGKGKGKVGRLRKQREVEESVEGSGSIDNVNEGEDPKENFRGLSDIEEYDSDELSQEYDSEDEEFLKDDFQTFKLSKRMVDYKWVLGIFFATKEDFKETIKTRAIHYGRNLKFKKNDNKRMWVICKKDYR